MRAYLLFPALIALSSHAQYMETLGWNFQGGNLVSNWSFENETLEICSSDQPGTGGGVTRCRERSDEARSGNYMLTVLALNQDDSAIHPFATSQISQPLPVEPSTDYTFSLYLRINWMEEIGSSRPVVCWLRADKSFIGCAEGQHYLQAFPNGASDWKPYSFDFKTSSEAQFLYFHLVQSDNDGISGGAGDYYEFEDLQIRRSGESSAVLEARSYSNAVGQVDQSVFNDGFKDRINQIEYDAQGRLFREYLPITQAQAILSDEVVVSALSLGGEMTVDYPTLTVAHADLKARVAAIPAAQLPAPSFSVYAIVAAMYDEAPVGTGPYYLEPLKTADGVEVPLILQGMVRGSPEYLDLSLRHSGPSFGSKSRGPFMGDFTAVRAAQYPGESNLFSQYGYPEPGVNTISSVSAPGNFYGPTAHLGKSGNALLTTPDFPATVEYVGDPGDTEASYTYSWNLAPQGTYTAQIFDARGLLLKSGIAKAATPSTPGMWMTTTFTYDTWGRPLTTTSPAGLVTSIQVDGQGQTAQIVDPDRGLVESLYDKQGQVRFTRSAEGRTGNYMVATQFDPTGRPEGVAKVPLASEHFTQAKADDPAFPGVPNLYAGALHDALESARFQEATHAPLSSLGFTPTLQNTQGRVAVGYNRNVEAVPPGSWTAADLLVASFYSYDSLGRSESVWKYIGAAPSGQRWHKIKYLYDTQSRLATTKVFADQTESQVVSQSQYHYDHLGRVREVRDFAGQSLTSYTYDVHDRVTKVDLPGGMAMSYGYDVQGKPLQTTATTSEKVLFQELLGYETKPHPGIADNLVFSPRFDGTIAALVRKFSTAAPNPVEYWRYEYDQPGRMSSFKKHLPSIGGELASDGSINFPVTFNEARTEDRGYSYSDDGTILGQTRFGQAYTYGYNAGTHQVNGVTPDLPSRFTDSGSFVFDEDGRLERDDGEGKSFLYNFADRPVRVIVPGKTFHFLYDEHQNRVAMLEDRGGAVAGRTVYVYEGGLKVVKEIVHREATHPDGAADIVKHHEYGQGGVVAVRFGGQSERHVLLKDHQGSVMMAVKTHTGAVAKEQGYLAYGEIEPRVVSGTDLQVSEGYTGKGFEDDLGLYYFGARWYDPEIGSFTSPDAAGQYFDPYSYGAGNPINGTDPDGNWFWIDDAIATGLGAVAGYVGYGIATGDWWSGQALAMAAVGAAAGEAALYTGGATLSAFGAIGVTGIGATAAAGAAGGAVGGAISGFGGYSVGAAAGDHSWNPGDAALATGLGVATGALGGAAGGGTSQVLGQYIASPVLRGAIGGGVGGYVGGASGSLLTGQSLGQANAAGINGLMLGVAMGSVESYAAAKMNGIDPWTGKNAPWPGNRGFEGPAKDHTLKPGDVIDRYGDENGYYASPEGTKFSERSLPLSTAKKPVTRYIVLEEIHIKAGPTAPAFGQPGKGTQYYFGDRPIRYHLKNGKLVQY